jgi:hypothetical protein
MCDCRECQRLESEYDRAIEVIRAVVRERFNSVREKIFALHEAQEVRDSHLRLLYDHRRNHPRKSRLHKRQRAVPSQESPALVLVS